MEQARLRIASGLRQRVRRGIPRAGHQLSGCPRFDRFPVGKGNEIGTGDGQDESLRSFCL